MAVAPIESQPTKVCFAAFEVDFVNRDLFKHGVRLKLSDQPFKILCMLLERPGVIVSREDLRQRLWPGNTNVQYDDSLNSAVRKLRVALSDTSEAPRYIETVARRGYRFTAVVRPIPEDVATAPLSATGETGSGKAVELVESEAVSSLPLDGRRKAHRLPLIGLALLVLTLTLVFLSVRSETKGVFIEFGHPPVTSWVRAIAKFRFFGKQNVAAPPQVRSLAVLPLENLSNDSTQEYFADGMTDQLISELAQIRSLNVISRTSAMQYKGVHRLLPKIAKELNVDAIVEGTVSRSGDQVRITASLIQAGTDKYLWSQSYQAPLRDVLDLQNQIAKEIADQVRVQLTPQEQASFNSKRAVNPEAYEDYLKGLYFWNLRDRGGLEKAVEYFQQATHKDPNYALAYAGLANSYVLLAGNRVSRKEFTPAAKAAANQAVSLDPTLAEAHTALASLAEHDFNFPEAEREYRLAINLEPNYATAHHWYGEGYLVFMGRFNEANREMKIAQQLDPISRIIATDWGVTLYTERRYSEAHQALSKVIEFDPEFSEALEFRGLALLQLGRNEEAIADFQSAARIDNSPRRLALLGFGYGIVGKTSAARAILRKLEEINGKTYVNPWCFALVYLSLRDNDRVFLWLERALKEHSPDLIALSVESIYDPLRNDPRFTDLIARVGLPQITVLGSQSSKHPCCDKTQSNSATVRQTLLQPRSGGIGEPGTAVSGNGSGTNETAFSGRHEFRDSLTPLRIGQPQLAHSRMLGKS